MSHWRSVKAKQPLATVLFCNSGEITASVATSHFDNFALLLTSAMLRTQCVQGFAERCETYPFW